MKLTIFHGGGIGPQDITIPNQPTDNTNPGVIPGGTTYVVRSTDSVILLDTSNGLVANAQLQAGTYVGETHTFVWFNWNVSEVPPVVLGPGGNPVGLVESFVIQAAATFNITNSKTLGTVDYAMTPFAGTSKIGFGCDFSSATHPYGFGLGGALFSAQDGSTLPFTMAGGTQTSAWTQASSLVLSGTTGTINLPPVTGYQWTVVNGGSGNATVQATGGTGVTIATGKTAIVRSDGTNMVRVSPDTLLDLDLLKPHLPGVPDNDNGAIPEQKAA